MAPPNKRRRLTGPRAQMAPSRSALIVPEPTPTLFHSVEQLEHKSVSAATRTVPQHIQEIHLQIQEKPFHGGSDDYGRVHRRQATAIETIITSVDDDGNTIMTTETIGLVTTTTSASTSPTTSSSGTGNTSNTKQTASGSESQSPVTKSPGTKSTGTGSVTSSSPTGSGTTLSHHTASDNSTSTHNSAKHTTGHTSNHSSSHTASSSGSSVYFATLKNGQVETLTRSNKPYVTTLANGQQSMICDLQQNCKITTDKSKATQTSSQENTSLSSPNPSSAVTSTDLVAGAGPTRGSQSPTSTITAGSQHSNDDSSTPPAGTIAGGVVGGAAGIAVILLIALIFLRWYKRRSQAGHHALPPSSTMSPDPDEPSISTGPGMAERAGLMPLVGAVPAFFRHQNRSQEEPPSSERSFQKVSGRKLPSAFSEGMSSGGMSSPPPNMPLTGPERNLSSTSFYRDSYGFYGGEGSPAEMQASPVGSPERGSPDQGDHDVAMTLSPGPRRTPTVHSAGPYVMSPSTSVPNTPRIPQTIPGSPPRNTTPTFTRSDTPSTDNRSSRFTEEV